MPDEREKIERELAEKELLAESRDKAVTWRYLAVTERIARRDAEREKDKAVRARKHTWSWIERHYGKLEDWARKELPEHWQKQFFSCVANGLWDSSKDVGQSYTCNAGMVITLSNYFESADSQLLYDQIARAESAELRAERAEAVVDLRRAVEVLEHAHSYLKRPTKHGRMGICDSLMLIANRLDDCTVELAAALSACSASKPAGEEDICPRCEGTGVYNMKSDSLCSGTGKLSAVDGCGENDFEKAYAELTKAANEEGAKLVSTEFSENDHHLMLMERYRGRADVYLELARGKLSTSGAPLPKDGREK